MSSLNEFTRRKTLHLWPITMLRVYSGLFFAYHGFGKIRSAGFGENLKGFVEGQFDGSYGFFKPFLESVVLPNNLLFGVLVSWGELLIGLGLIVGLATRYASVAGAVLVASFWFTKGQSPFAAQNHDVLWLMIFIFLASVHAGRVHSLDARLADRFRFLA